MIMNDTERAERRTRYGFNPRLTKGVVSTPLYVFPRSL